MSESQEQSLDVLGMSDDAVRDMPVPDFDSMDDTSPEVEESPLEDGQGSDHEDRDDDDKDSGQGSTDEEPGTGDDDGDDEGDTKPKEEPIAINFEAEYKRLLEPFNANGKSMQVNSVDDALTLMKMGANYNKKMAGLKPNLKLMKMLDNNGLLDEAKLNHLIDISKKNPEAISKLLKDSGIDPMDLDIDSADNYQQSNNAVHDKEIELDTVLSDLRGSAAFAQTLDIVGSQWDSASRDVFAESPSLIKVVHDHVESGVYDIISKEMESAKMLGRLNGLSDLEAYRQVGDAIQARGGFDHLVQQGNQNTRRRVVAAPNPKKVTDTELNDKRRAASPTKAGAPNKSSNDDFNPLAMSDEEFGKIVKPNIL